MSEFRIFEQETPFLMAHQSEILCYEVMGPYKMFSEKGQTNTCIPCVDSRLDHVAMNSTTAVAGKAGITLTSAATAVVEFVSAHGIKAIKNCLHIAVNIRLFYGDLMTPGNI